jgi:hypothetical protein
MRSPITLLLVFFQIRFKLAVAVGYLSCHRVWERVMPEPTTVDSSSVLVTLLLCGLIGLLGQGVRAAVGLKKSLGVPQGQATQQATFSAAYFGLSLMIGFVAGVLAGIVIGLQKLIKIDLENMKLLLGIAVAGYAGADFIENSLSIVIPNANPQPTGQNATPPAAPAPPATSDQGTALRTLGAHTQTLNNSVLALTSVVNALPSFTSTIPSFTAALHSTASGVNTQVWVPALTSGFSQFGISTNKRIAAAIGQFLVEAGANFQEITEDLTYTHASRLVQIFPMNSQPRLRPLLTWATRRRWVTESTRTSLETEMRRRGMVIVLEGEGLSSLPDAMSTRSLVRQ